MGYYVDWISRNCLTFGRNITTGFPKHKDSYCLCARFTT